ncbi:MAG: hypothetical protein ACFFBI_06385 [Promethearchaeota archaeon]
MSEEWKHANWVSWLGKLAWIIVIVSSALGIIFSIVSIAETVTFYTTYLPGTPIPIQFWPVWNIIWGIILILIAIIIIRPKFSKPCGEKDWDRLYDWYLKIGGAKVPWMFIWGIFYAIFGWYVWGAALILIPAIMLIWVGPRKYDWK